MALKVCSKESLDTPHEGPRKLTLAEVLAEFARLKKENEAHAKRQMQKMNARDSEGNKVYNNLGKNKVKIKGRAGEDLEVGLKYEPRDDRYYAAAYHKGKLHHGPYQVVRERAVADLQQLRKKLKLPDPRALVGPFEPTPRPSAPYPEEWLAGASDFIKVFHLKAMEQVRAPAGELAVPFSSGACPRKKGAEQRERNRRSWNSKIDGARPK